MNLKTVLRWSFAFFCAALCYFSALTWLSGQGFTAVLHYDKEKSQPFASYDAWQDELKEEPVEEIVATAAWASGGRGSLSTELKSAMVDIFYAKGNAALILPVNMLSGHMPMDDYYSVALDSVSAYALYGAEDIVGRQVEMNDREYTVCGVFEAPVGIFAWGNSSGRGMAFLTPAQEQKIMSVGLLLDDSPEETVQRANNLGMMMGGSDYTENRRLLADFMRQFGLLPLWIWAISALIPMALGVFRFLRRGPKYDPLTSSPGQRFLDFFSRLMVLAAFAGTVYGLLRLTDFSPVFPTAWIPTSWSDFQHWLNLLESLGETWAQARQLPVLRPELMRWTLCGITVISGVLAIVLKPRRIRDEFPAFFLFAAMMPLLTIAVAWYLGSEIVFAPVLIVLPAICVFAQWMGDALGNARDYRGVGHGKNRM